MTITLHIIIIIIVARQGQNVRGGVGVGGGRNLGIQTIKKLINYHIRFIITAHAQNFLAVQLNLLQGN